MKDKKSKFPSDLASSTGKSRRFNPPDGRRSGGYPLFKPTKFGDVGPTGSSKRLNP